MADGSIIFNTALDNKQLEKELYRLKSEISKLENSISGQEGKKSPFVQQAQALEQKMSAAREEVEHYRAAWTSGVSGADKEQSDAIAKAQQLAAEHAKVVSQIDRVDAKLQPAYEKLDEMKERAGGMAQQLGKASKNSNRMGDAVQRAGKSLDRFKARLREVVRSALIFTAITQALAKLRDWTGKVIQTNTKASAAVAQLKGALLTMAQPLVSIVIPAFIFLVNVLTRVVNAIAQVMSLLFGMTIEQSKAAAKSLHEETNALEGTGAAAKRAKGELAAFDEINQLTSESDSGGGGSNAPIQPDFSGVGNTDWLKARLGESAGYITAALALGGIALIAIGASMGNLLLITSGLILLGASMYVGTETGVLHSWVDALGLNSVSEFIAIALLLGGVALVALGAMTANILMVLAGLGLLGAGVAVGARSGALASWAEALGIESVYDHVAAAMQIAGIALVAIGAAMANIAMVIAGGALIALGVGMEIIGEETIKEWWEVLQLTTVQQWVGAALLLVGIALIAIGAAMANILMILAGAVALGIGTAAAATNGNLKDWVSVLGLEKVTGWVTAALLLAGIGLVVFGICSGNILMVLAGLGLLGAGIAVGATSGTFESWTDSILLGLKSGWDSIKAWWSANVAPKLTIQYWKTQFDGIKEGLISKIKDAVNGGIGLLNRFIGWLNSKLNLSWGSFSLFGKEIIPSGSFKLLSLPSIPMLAQGAVIPANREFLAVLGDQTHGTNIETPEALLRKIFREELGGSGSQETLSLLRDILQAIRSGKVLMVDKKVLARVTADGINDMTRAAGKSILLI